MSTTPHDLPQANVRGWLVCGLAALMGMVPLWPGAGLPPHDLQRLAACLILLAAASLLCWRPGWIPRGRHGLAWAGLGLLVLASCWHSRYPWVALQESALWLGLLGWACVCRQQALAGAERPLLRAMAGGMAAYAALVLLLYALSLGAGQPLDVRSFIVGFSNPRFLNHVQTVAVPMLWLVAASDADRRWRLLALCAAVGQVALAALTLARATFLAWAVTLLVLTLLRERRVSRQGWACLVAGLLGAALIFLVLPHVLGTGWQPSFARPAELNAAHSRDLLWAAAVDQFLQSPWLGQGPMHFAATVNATGAHPHNVYLQLAAELGLPGALLLLGLLLAPVAQALRRIGTAEPLLAGAAAAALAALVDGAFSGNFVMPLSQLWIAAAWGLLAGALARMAPVVRHGGPLWSARGLAWVLLFSQLSLCAAAVTQAQREPPRVRAESPVPGPGQLYRPRFWLEGWI